MKKPEVGQRLYSLNIGNAARHRKQELTPVTVTKVGRKYFTCTKDGRGVGTEYYIDGWHEKTESSSNSRLYESEKEWEDQKEWGELKEKLRIYFASYGKLDISLDKLRKIDSIINN